MAGRANKCATTELAVLRPAAPLTGTVLDDESAAYLASLSVDELKQAIQDALQQVEASVTRTTAAMRKQLLPALLVLRERIPHGEWEGFLESVNLNPATVRKWRQRERQSAEFIAAIVGKPSQRRKPNREISRSAAQELANFGYRVAKAVLRRRNEVPKAIVQLAEEFTDAYEQAA